MPWGRIDDSLYDHPKLDRIPAEHRLAAIGLWTRSISWCNRFLTDGFVPRDRVVKLDGTTELADLLVAAGLFDRPAGTGYEVHDFLAFNDSREQVESRRTKEAKRKADWRAQHRPTGSPNGTPRTTKANVPRGVTAGRTAGQKRPSQRDSRTRESRPDPSKESTHPNPSRPREGRGRKKNGLERDSHYYDDMIITDPPEPGDKEPDDLSFEVAGR